MNPTFLYFASDSFKSRAKVLTDSIKKFYPDSKIVHVQPNDQRIGSYIPGMAKQRLMKALELLEDGEPNVIIIGADCELFWSLDAVEFSLDMGMNMCLIPHVNQPIDNRDYMAQLYVTGHANADFIAINNTPKAKEALKWLISMTEGHEERKGIFYEQTWLSALPFLFDDIDIIREPGYNIGYWDIDTSALKFSFKGTDPYIGDKYRVKFVQYSGFEKGKAKFMSRYCNKVATGDVLKLYEDYDKRIEK